MPNEIDLLIMIGVSAIVIGIIAFVIAPKLRRMKPQYDIEFRVRINALTVLQIDSESLKDMIRYGGAKDYEWCDLLYGGMAQVIPTLRSELGMRSLEIEARIIDRVEA